MTPTLTRYTVRVNGIRMHVAEAGKGAPVVLLHGYPETWYAWRNQWPDLARDYHVIMPDLRGYGDSDKPDSGYDKRTMGGYPATARASRLWADQPYRPRPWGQGRNSICQRQSANGGSIGGP